jgi:hypothetical protein
MSNNDSGLVIVGGLTPSYTYSDPMVKILSNPEINDTVNYKLLRFNKELDKFYREDSTVSIVCTDTAKYVSVPAGVFKCVELTYSYYYNKPVTDARNYNTNQIVSNDGVVINIGKSYSRDENDYLITVKLYYAYGVGYVQNLTYLNSSLVQKKVLSSYLVNEKKAGN